MRTEKWNYNKLMRNSRGREMETDSSILSALQLSSRMCIGLRNKCKVHWVIGGRQQL